MQNLENITETKHAELLALINPLVDYMAENNFNFFLVAGKDETCTGHMRGTFDDVTGMLTGFMENNKDVEVFMKNSVESFNKGNKI